MKRRIWLLVVGISMILAGCKSGTQGDSDTAAGTATQTEGQTATDDSLQKVLDSGKLRAGAEGNWNPFVYNDANDGGTLKGYDV